MQLQISPVEGTADIPYGSKDQTRHTSHKEADVGAGLENIPAIRATQPGGCGATGREPTCLRSASGSGTGRPLQKATSVDMFPEGLTTRVPAPSWAVG